MSGRLAWAAGFGAGCALTWGVAAAWWLTWRGLDQNSVTRRVIVRVHDFYGA